MTSGNTVRIRGKKKIKDRITPFKISGHLGEVAELSDKQEPLALG